MNGLPYGGGGGEPMTIYDEAMQMKEELVACRRDLHAHPELAWTEFRTASQ